MEKHKENTEGSPIAAFETTTIRHIRDNNPTHQTRKYALISIADVQQVLELVTEFTEEPLLWWQFTILVRLFQKVSALE